jgi:hypothetical protein
MIETLLLFADAPYRSQRAISKGYRLRLKPVDH